MSKVVASDPRPPYVQIADQLREAIDAGELKAGERLPSGRTLADDFDVAPMTVQHAIRLLREEGRLTSWQGRGVFVATPDDQAKKSNPERSDERQRLDQLERDVRALRERVAKLEDH